MVYIVAGSAPGDASVDAWTFALELSRPYFAAPPARELPIEFASEALRLGAVTRRFHEARAGDEDSADFALDPATHEDLDQWVDSARHAVESSLALLDRQLGSSTFVQSRVAEAQALVRRRKTYLARIDELADSLGDDLGMRIRPHGNYELGKVLRTATGEFEIVERPGERLPPSDERTWNASPLRDVSCMLRSVGYASATLVASVEKTSDLPTRELRAGRWERDVRAAFLAGYTGETDDDALGILPEEPETVAGLIALFETEKAFDQLASELNDRPAWAWIPMRGIAKLLAR